MHQHLFSNQYKNKTPVLSYIPVFLKISFSVILASSFYLNSYTQTSFLNIHTSSEDGFCNCIVETSNTFIFSTYNEFEDCGFPILYIISKNGLLLDSILFEKKTDTYYTIKNIHKNEEEIICTGTYNDINIGQSCIFTAYIKPNLKDIDICYINLGEDCIIETHSIYFNNKLHILSTALNSNSDRTKLIFLTVADKTIVQRKEYENQNILALQTDFDFDRNNNTFWVSGDGLSINTGSGLGDILVFDNNFDSINSFKAPQFIKHHHLVKTEDSTNFLCGSVVQQPYLTKVFSLDNNFNVLKTHLLNSGDSSSRNALYKSIDIKNSNVFTLQMNSTEQSYIGFWFGQPRTLQVTAYDQQLNKKFQYWYGGEFCLTPVWIEATQDGGCLVCSVLWDRDQTLQRDYLILKLNENGVVTWTTEIPLPDLPNGIYPNPAKQYIHIKDKFIPGTLQIFDMNGKLILETVAKNTIDISNLVSGNFIYRIFDEKGVISSAGKMIVE